MPAATHHGASYSLLTLCARSADFRGSLNTRRDESYHGTSLSDIVQKVAARNKLNATQAAGLGTIKVSHIDQTQETDVAFITRLASLNTASNKEQSGITLDLTRSLRKQVFLCLPNGCRHFIAISETGPSEGPVLQGWKVLGNKKPDSLEPKKAGLTGSTKWGHQRKAVALIQTTPGKESSRRR